MYNCTRRYVANDTLEQFAINGLFPGDKITILCPKLCEAKTTYMSSSRRVLLGFKSPWTIGFKSPCRLKLWIPSSLNQTPSNVSKLSQDSGAECFPLLHTLKKSSLRHRTMLCRIEYLHGNVHWVIPRVQNSLVHRQNQNLLCWVFYFSLPSGAERQARRTTSGRPPICGLWNLALPAPGAPGRRAPRVWPSIRVRTGFGSDLERGYLIQTPMRAYFEETINFLRVPKDLVWRRERHCFCCKKEVCFVNWGRLDRVLQPKWFSVKNRLNFSLFYHFIFRSILIVIDSYFVFMERSLSNIIRISFTRIYLKVVLLEIVMDSSFTRLLFMESFSH